MYVIAQRRIGVHGFHNVTPEIPRVRRCKADTLDSGNVSHRHQQLGKALLRIGIAVRVHVLPEQLNLRVAEVVKLTRFSNNRRRCPAALLAPRKWHHAIGAEFVAALDDRDVSAMRIGPGGVLGFEAVIGLTIVQSGGATSRLDLHEHLWQVPVRGRSADHRDVRRPLKNLLAFLLSHAADHAELLALFLELAIVGEAMKDLLLRFVADRACVVEDEPGFLNRWNLPVALLDQSADHLFGVVHIHLAAEGLEVKRLVRGPRHQFQYKAGKDSTTGEHGRTQVKTNEESRAFYP